VQILLNNLLYDVSQTALASDHVDAAYLRQPRRWDIGNIWRSMLYLGPLSSLFDYLTFGALWYLFDAARQPALFQSGWFLESLLTQTLVVHVLRTGKIPFVQSKPSTPLLATTLAVCALGVWLPLSGFGGALGLVAPPGGYWLALPAIVAAYLVAAQLLKHWMARRYGQL